MRMARFTFEDTSGAALAVMFPDDLATQSELVANDHICFLEGKVDRSREPVQIIVNKLTTLERATERFSRTMLIRLDSSVQDRSHIERLKTAFAQHPGPTVVQLEIRTNNGLRVSLKTGSTVRATRELTEEIEAIVGMDTIRLAATNGNGT
jgi:DNA polymerase III alpha subunit